MKTIILLTGAEPSEGALTAVCRAAKEGIRVSVVVFCEKGAAAPGLAKWKEAARLGGGECVSVPLENRTRFMLAWMEKEWTEKEWTFQEKPDRFPHAVHRIRFIDETFLSGIPFQTQKDIQKLVRAALRFPGAELAFVLDAGLAREQAPAWLACFRLFSEVLRELCVPPFPPVHVLYSPRDKEEEPFVLDWSEWKFSYRGLCRHLPPDHGLSPERALSEAIRLFKMRTVRTPLAKPRLVQPYAVKMRSGMRSGASSGTFPEDRPARGPYLFFAASLILFASALYSVLQ